jgi:hypothetical protein
MGEMLNRQDIEKDLVRKSNHKGWYFLTLNGKSKQIRVFSRFSL